MTEIKAIVQPFQLSAVVAALQAIKDLPGITVFDVRGFGRHRAGHTGDGIEDEGILDAKRVQIELVVPDRLTETVVRTIRESAHTGNPGDGKIFASRIDGAVRIRTGERGDAAL
jgi:nitrogen regulatory protein P-II 1